MVYALIRLVFSPIIRLLWVRRVEGLENIPPRGPVILAANHNSYFDFICMIAIVPRPVYFLAAESFYKSWFWRPIMAMTGQIRVDRASKDKRAVFDGAKKILSEGKALGIFPEGTRSRTGKMQKFYNGAAIIAKENGVDIVPVAIKGTYDILTPNEKWPHLRKIAEYKFLPPIEVTKIEKDPETIVQKILMPKIAEEVKETC